MTTPTTTRVQQHTKTRVNERIREQIERNITYYACIDGKGDGALDTRLRELDHEWDIERLLEANAASFSLLGLVHSKSSRQELPPYRDWYVPGSLNAFLQLRYPGKEPPLMSTPRRQLCPYTRSRMEVLQKDF